MKTDAVDNYAETLQFKEALLPFSFAQQYIVKEELTKNSGNRFIFE